MENKAIFAIIAAAVLFAGCVNIGNERTITTTGDAERQVQPDVAEIFFTVQTNDTSAQIAQDNNSRITAAIVDALKRAGVASADIETLSYSIQPNIEYDYINGKSMQNGFIANQQIKVTARDMQKVGTYLSVAVDAGATTIQSVQFSLTKEHENTLKAEVLAEASAAAKTKAQAIATGLGAKLGPLKTISESNWRIFPYMYGGIAEAASAIRTGAPVPPINPSKVTVTASITVSYDIIGG
ncbi:MAG TPA: SIMPL domain-containing protein [Candidatus Norongarragalinales archaeon]|jgi:hypothetical protein|nr:SIMPL domain-containing protein [Candidatus Norongarragalinales archaeon]